MIRIDDLDKKLVLVTGASTGIGAAVARAFAAQGASVALHFKSNVAAATALADSIRDAGGTALLLEGDLSEPGVPQRVAEVAARLLGGLVLQCY